MTNHNYEYSSFFWAPWVPLLNRQAQESSRGPPYTECYLGQSWKPCNSQRIKSRLRQVKSISLIGEKKSKSVYSFCYTKL
jgi:hypothetical protein